MRVFITAEAELDLERIGDSIAEHNAARAVTFVDELLEKCLGLALQPRSYSRIEFDRGVEIRRRVYGNYLIFFKIGDERIDVLHVLHGAMDHERILFGDA